MSFQYRSAYTGPLSPQAIARPEDLRATNSYQMWAKRAMDLAIVMIVSLPVAMTILILAAIVALDGANPFYLQERVGRGGRIFKMLKLRSMVSGADRLLEAHLDSDPAARAEWDRHQKLRNDPRITRFGHFLRSSSLDELPQLWNVLKGEMSLVGPRPMMTSQRVLYPGTEYYAMRPGITGFWQISVRNESCFHERADYDRRYYNAISFGTDMSVMAKTVGVVMRATGH